MGDFGIRYSLKDKIKAKTDKTEHGNRKSVKSRSRRRCPIFDDDDDEEYTIQVREYYKNSPVAITPDFPITDSLVIEDEHLDTISETESDEENESSVEDPNLTPSEFEDLSDIKSECDVPVCDDFTTFSNPLFDSNDDFTSSDDKSLSDEDVPEENFKIYLNPLFDEEIISTKIDLHHFNAESYFCLKLFILSYNCYLNSV
ncbi:hypothetical protein Tco_0226763 [Tanacetum coccineum]